MTEEIKATYLLVNKNQNDRDATERCAPSSPQKHITKESGGVHNCSTLLIMLKGHTIELVKGIRDLKIQRRDGNENVA